MKEFSKRVLFADYIITLALITGFFLCLHLNGMYTKNLTEKVLTNGYDLSLISVQQQPYPLDGFGIILGIWIAQLGLSSGAYYMMCRSDHRIQLPVLLINEMPEDIKNNVDMTQIITTVLSTSDN